MWVSGHCDQHHQLQQQRPHDDDNNDNDSEATESRDDLIYAQIVADPQAKSHAQDNDHTVIYSELWNDFADNDNVTPSDDLYANLSSQTNQKLY